MATEEKKYIINFDDNLDVYAKRAVEAKKAVDELKSSNEKFKKEQEDLQNAGKLNAEQIAANTVEIEKRNAALKAAEIEYKNTTKQVQLATQANAAQKGSYDELYKRWQLAQVELKRIGDTVPKNANDMFVLSKRFEEQSKVVDQAKRALNEFGKQTSDNRLNVGNYSEAIDGAISKFISMPGPIGAAAKGVQGGVGTITTAFNALKANPIIAVITAIIGIFTGLIKILKSTDKGATEYAARMEELKAILDVLRTRVIAITSAIGNIFKGNWKQASKEMKEAFTGVGDQINEAAKAGYNYIKTLDEIDDAEKNYISQAADNRNKIAKLEYTAQDRTKSTEERKKALDEAIQIGTEEAQMAVKFADDKLNAEVDYLAGKAGLRREDVLGFIKMTDAEQAAASESLKTLRNNNEEKFKLIEGLYANAIDADTKFYEENKRNQSKATGFAEELRKQEIDRLNNIATINELENKMQSEHNKTLLAKMKADYDKRIDQEGLSYQEREKLLTEYQNKVREIEINEATQTKQILKERLDADLKDTKLTNTQRLVLKQQYKEAVNAIDEEQQRNEIARSEERRKRLDQDQKAEIAAGIEFQRLKAANLEKQGKENLDLLNKILDAEYMAMKESGDYDQLGANQKILADQKYYEAKQELEDKAILRQEEIAQRSIDLDKLVVENKDLSGQNTIALQESILDQEYQLMTKSLEYSRMTADQQTLIDQKYTNDKKRFSNLRIQQSETEKKLVGDALGVLSQIVGQETAAGKAFAVAQATINTWLAASQTLRDPTIPSTVARIAAMIGIIGTGLMTVRNILKVDTSGKSTSAPSGSVGSTSTETGTGAPATQRVVAPTVQPQTNNVINTDNQAKAIVNSPAVINMTAPTQGASVLNQPKMPNVIVNVPPQKTLTTEDLTTAFKSLPSPVVTVEDINARNYEVNKIEVRANI